MLLFVMSFMVHWRWLSYLVDIVVWVWELFVCVCSLLVAEWYGKWVATVSSLLLLITQRRHKW